MGSSELRELSTIEEVDIDELEGKKAAVDAYNWLYKYVTTTVRFTDSDIYTTVDGTEVPNLIGVVRGLKRFFKNDIQPVFVFDGGAHDLKHDELHKRKQAKQKAKEKVEKAKSKGDEIEAAKQDARSKRLTKPMVKSTMELFEALDVPYTVSPQSGESQAAYMVKEGDFDIVISDDYDTLLFNAPVTIRNFTSSSKPFEKIDLEKTLDNLGIRQGQLIDIAILCGTDYNEGVSGYGPKLSLKAIKKHGEIRAIPEDIEVSNLSEVRTIFMTPEVVSDFPEAKQSKPDIEKARSILNKKWEIPQDETEKPLSEIEELTTQTGLDDWG